MNTYSPMFALICLANSASSQRKQTFRSANIHCWTFPFGLRSQAPFGHLTWALFSVAPSDHFALLSKVFAWHHSSLAVYGIAFAQREAKLLQVSDVKNRRKGHALKLI